MTRLLFTIWLLACAAMAYASSLASPSLPTLLGQPETAPLRGGEECAYQWWHLGCTECFNSTKCNSSMAGTVYRCRVLEEGVCEYCTTTADDVCDGTQYGYPNADCTGEETEVGPCNRAKNTYTSGSCPGTCPQN